MKKIRWDKQRIILVIGIGIVIISFLVFFIYGYLNRSNFILISDNPKIEMYTDFDALSNLKGIKNGNIEEVTVDVSKVNTNVLGDYPVTYVYKGEEIQIIVSVVDTLPPTFDVKELEIDLGMSVDPLEMVENIEDTTTTKVLFDDDYKFSKEGDVRVVVVVEDERGNRTEKESIVHVLSRDEIAPTIYGIENRTVQRDATIDFLTGIRVVDNRDPKPTISVNSDTLNLHELGEYAILYIAKDRSGNDTKKTCQVSVVERKEIGTSTQSDEKIVYLTFDDGPSKYTKEILDILDQYNAKATFFVTGMNPDFFYLIKETEARGHTIGMHTYSHNYSYLYSSLEAYYDDLSKVADICQQQIGYVPRYIRFPGGGSNSISKRYSRGIMSELVKDVVEKGYQYYDWNASSGDGSGSLAVATLVANSTASKSNNIVLLAHDANGKRTTVEALPQIIEYYQQRGYRFFGISDTSFAPHHAVSN